MYEIRETLEKDSWAIALINVDWWKHAYKEILPMKFLDWLSYEKKETNWKKRILEKRLLSFVLEEDSKIFWYISFSISWDICKLLWLYLRPDKIWYWYWSKLLSFVESNFKFKKMILFVLEWNNLWIGFYLNKWFSFTWNTELLEVEWKTFNELEMEKIY